MGSILHPAAKAWAACPLPYTNRNPQFFLVLADGLGADWMRSGRWNKKQKDYIQELIGLGEMFTQEAISELMHCEGERKQKARRQSQDQKREIKLRLNGKDLGEGRDQGLSEGHSEAGRKGEVLLWLTQECAHQEQCMNGPRPQVPVSSACFPYAPRTLGKRSDLADQSLWAQASLVFISASHCNL